jgi:hypothetical protein
MPIEPPSLREPPAIVVPAPAPKPVPKIVAPAGKSWNWPGDLKQHLQSSHGFTAAQLNGKTFEQMRAMHDDSHNAAVVMPPPVMYVQPQSGCPGGVCPAPQSAPTFRGIFGRRG